MNREILRRELNSLRVLTNFGRRVRIAIARVIEDRR